MRKYTWLSHLTNQPILPFTGSPLHVIKALEHPRWEDYDYEYIDGKGRLYWFGNGNTMADVDPEVDSKHLAISLGNPLLAKELTSFFSRLVSRS